MEAERLEVPLPTQNKSPLSNGKMHRKRWRSRAMASLLPVVNQRQWRSRAFPLSEQGICRSTINGLLEAEKEIVELIHHPVDLGIRIFDNSAIHGPDMNGIVIGKGTLTMMVTGQFGVIEAPTTLWMRTGLKFHL